MKLNLKITKLNHILIEDNKQYTMPSNINIEFGQIYGKGVITISNLSLYQDEFKDLNLAKEYILEIKEVKEKINE